MAATSWAFTGVDAPKISCLILGCSIGSEVTTIQQVGRVLRKADNKTDCVIFDFFSKETSLRKQANSRKKHTQLKRNLKLMSLNITIRKTLIFKKCGIALVKL